MDDLRVGRITFSIGGRRYEMSGPDLAVDLPEAAAVVAGAGQWRSHQEKLRAEGAAAERARIRKELLEAAERAEDGDDPKYWNLTDFYFNLDRICPEKGE